MDALRQFVSSTMLHPVLVNFTAALIPVSVATDFLARLRRSEPLRHAGWLTLLYATLITPLTAITGWLFWMSDDNRDPGMAIHKWLGTAFVLLLFALFAWRARLRRRAQWPSTAYLITGAILVGVMIIQGHLGGTHVFSNM